jgi:hypothetical protein
MRIIALVGALLLSACGATLAGGSPSPLVSALATASAPAAPTGRLPGSVVRITVNGVPYPQGSEMTLTPTGGSVAIVMAFPFAVDRPSLERSLPRTAAVTWTDDRTVRLVIPETETNISFKAVQVAAVDKTAVIDLFTVQVAFPATRVINLFTVQELTDGTRVPAAATAYRVTAPGGLTVSPDGRRAIAFDGIQTGPGGTAPALIDLATRARMPLAQPTLADGPFAFADWLADGRLLIVGRDVWLGAGDGNGMRKVADATAAVGGLPWTAVPNAAGDRVAIWGYNTDGHVAVVDLRDGTIARVTGPFRRSAADARVSLAWSRDGALLAGTDSDSEAGPAKARVRIVNVPTDRTLRTIEGGVFGISALPTGELLVVRDAGEQGAGARNLGLVLGFDGVERRRYLGGWWSMSPDARYLLQMEAGGAGMAGYTLIELPTGRSFFFGVSSGFGRWLADGRAAFY